MVSKTSCLKVSNRGLYAYNKSDTEYGVSFKLQDKATANADIQPIEIVIHLNGYELNQTNKDFGRD